MKVSLLQSHLVELKYNGSETTHTIAVDADGGTGSAGEITLTDSTAHVIDLGVTTTLAALITAVEALDGWQIRASRTGPSTEIFAATDISAEDLLADVATEVVGVEYKQHLPFANGATPEIAGSTTASPEGRCPVNVGCKQLVTLELGVTPIAAVSDNVTATFGVSSSPGVDGNGEVAVLTAADFDTSELVSIVLAQSGVIGQRTAETLDIEVGSVDVITLVGVTTAGANEVTIDASVLR